VGKATESPEWEESALRVLLNVFERLGAEVMHDIDDDTVQAARNFTVGQGASN